jgi:hypothetical protein
MDSSFESPTMVLTCGYVLLLTCTSHGPCCHDPAAVLERRLGRRWTTFGGGICLGIFPSGRVVLEPGSIRASSSGVHVAEPGEYRLVIATERGRVVSPAFAVR